MRNEFSFAADYLTKVVVMGKSSSELPVSDIMTPQSKLMTVSPQQSVVDVMTLMTDNNFRHVPVVSLRQSLLHLNCAASSCDAVVLVLITSLYNTRHETLHVRERRCACRLTMATTLA